MTLSPIGFDIVLALSQAPGGLRLADLSRVIGSPVSSVQTALRILVANELVRRESVEPPRYRLAPGHPAHDELVSLATVLPEPAHAIGVILRANPVVTYASVDSGGFLCAVEDPPLDEAALAALDRQLDLVDASRPDTPTIIRMNASELDRMVQVAMGLRDRIRKGLTVKGHAPAGAASGTGEERSRRQAG